MKKRAIQYNAGLVRIGTAVLLCGVAALAIPGAKAQGGTSPASIQDQVPSSFPSMIDQPPVANGAPAAPQTQNTSNPAQAAANAAAGQPSAPAPATGAAPAAAATTPEEIPTQPEQRKLVPATPMGTAAQSVNSGAAPNPVEDAAAAADQQLREAQAKEPPPAASDILEKYTAKSDTLQAQSGVDPDASGDALPGGTQGTMTFEGVGFDNAATNRVEVPINGSLDAGKSKAELQAEISDEAFDAAITGMFPLSPNQIQSLLKRYDSTQVASQKPPYNLPTPEISVQNISLDPGVAPPSIKTAVGNVTTLNILDATGAPWPVQDVTWAGDFEIVEPEEGGHIIRITPMAHQARGNIVIRLLTLKTPLTLTLETSRDTVQYRVDARVPEYGPFASAPLMSGGKSLVAGDSTLTSVLDGTPASMTKLEVAGADGRTTAYTDGSTTYVRTPLTLLSPAWKSSVSSADGMNVYALANAPVLLLSDEGSFVRATLTEKEGLLDE